MDEDALLARAAKERSSGDVRAAMLDLKNVLRKNPANGKARLALGELALQTGDSDAAVRELESARKSGVSPGQVVVPLSRAYLARRRPEDALKLLGEPRSPGAAELLTLKGEAFIELNRSAEARQSFELALKDGAKGADALLGLAAAVAPLDGIPAALAVSERALQVAPDDARVRILRGQLQMRAQAPALAQKEFEQAVRAAEHAKQSDRRFAALAGQAEALLAQANVAESLAVTQRLQEAAPDNPLSRFMRARALLLANKPEAARPLLEKNVSQSTAATESRLLLGLIALNDGYFGQADMYLSSVISAQPDNIQARRLLAQARLRQRKPADALQALLPAVESATPDTQLLTAAGKLSIAAGHSASGLEYLERSAKAEPGNIATKLDLAAGYLAAGQVDRASALLESSPVDAANAAHHRFLKVIVLLAKGDKTGAVNFATATAAHEFTDADAQLLAGSLLASQKQFVTARTYFERAVTLRPDTPSAYVSLGRIELMQGHVDLARTQFARALEHAPADPSASLAMADLELGARHPEQALAVLADALKAHPTLSDARLRQVQILARTGKLDQADAAAREAVRMTPENPAAIESLARVALLRGKVDEADRYSADLARLAPEQAATQLLLGEVQLAQKHFAAAAAAYRKAGILRPDTAAAIGEFRALRLGALADPSGPLRRLVEQRPKDVPARLALAQAQQQLGDAPAAIRTYQSALERDPNNAAVLNNLAWLYYESKDPKALALAQRAYAAAPADARITDTYAWLLVESGQLQQGLALLAPIAAAGADEEVRMHYAQALAKAGKRAEARALGAHLAASASAKVSDEARRLVAELDRG